MNEEDLKKLLFSNNPKDIEFAIRHIQSSRINSSVLLKKWNLIEYGITNLSQFIDLDTIDCSDRGISTIAPLAGLHIKKLICTNNQISDLSPIENLPELAYLNCTNNLIEKINAKSKSIRELILDNNFILNFAGLDKMENLEILSAQSNNLKDINGIKHNKKLVELYVQDNKISDLSPLSSIISLQVLNCAKNSIADISGIKNLKNLSVLDMSNNKISDLSPIAYLQSISIIAACYNQITDLSFLKSNKTIKVLYLWNNQNLEDLSPLSQLPLLNTIHIQNCAVKGISMLQGLTNLVDFKCYNNQIPEKEINMLRSSLIYCTIEE